MFLQGHRFFIAGKLAMSRGREATTSLSILVCDRSETTTQAPSQTTANRAWDNTAQHSNKHITPEQAKPIKAAQAQATEAMMCFFI